MEFNIYIENEYQNWEIDETKIKNSIINIFEFYLKTTEITENSCLAKYEFDTISFDFLFCDSKKTHEINKEYRNKDYPADIITFAVFADSEEDERFVLDLEINLGEIIIGLDKIIEEAAKKEITKETELLFIISHGIMHLLGFDHQTEDDFNFVIKHQKAALESIGIKYDKI
jgi:probable rRNA maturation factor